MNKKVFLLCINFAFFKAGWLHAAGNRDQGPGHDRLRQGREAGPKDQASLPGQVYRVNFVSVILLCIPQKPVIHVNFYLC